MIHVLCGHCVFNFNVVAVAVVGGACACLPAEGGSDGNIPTCTEGSPGGPAERLHRSIWSPALLQNQNIFLFL